MNSKRVKESAAEHGQAFGSPGVGRPVNHPGSKVGRNQPGHDGRGNPPLKHLERGTASNQVPEKQGYRGDHPGDIERAAEPTEVVMPWKPPGREFWRAILCRECSRLFVGQGPAPKGWLNQSSDQVFRIDGGAHPDRTPRSVDSPHSNYGQYFLTTPYSSFIGVHPSTR